MKRPGSPLVRMYGGKFKIGERIAFMMPEHRLYVDCFGGGGNMLRWKPESQIEVYNDLDGELVNLFQVIRESPEKLARALQLTPFSRLELQRAQEPCAVPVCDGTTQHLAAVSLQAVLAKTSTLCAIPLERRRHRWLCAGSAAICPDCYQEAEAEGLSAPDRVERARRVLVKSWQGRAAFDRSNSGFRFHFGNNRSTSPASEWQRLPATIEDFRMRFEGVAIECDDALSVIDRYDLTDALLYVDPPYLPHLRHSRRSYFVEDGVDGHERLLERLARCKSMVVLSGYNDPLYAVLHNWQRVEIDTVTAAGKKATESVWLSPRCWEQLEPMRQMSLRVAS